jgi:hypothetical protein
VIGAYNLLPTVLDAYGLPMPKYFEYLLDMMEISKGYEVNLVLDPDDSYRFLWEIDGGGLQAMTHDDYRMLQYDYIFGKKYARALFADGER